MKGETRTRARRTLLLALCGLLGLPAVADAYVIAGKPWPRGAITYHVGAKNRAAVDAAARAWSRSGVRVRLRPAPRSRARLWIASAPRLGCAGYAQVGYHPWLRRASIVLGDCDGRRWPMTQIAIHEFGHLLGLGHERRRCATMNPTLSEHGPGACGSAGALRYRCRAIEPDDLRGALRLYGGRRKRVGPATCPLFEAPGALAGLSASADPDEELLLTVRYRLPAAPRMVVDTWPRPSDQRVQVAAAPGACPGAPASLLRGGYASALPPAGWERPAERWLHVDAAGPHCVVARLVDSLGRSGPVSATSVDVPPPLITVGIRGYPETVAGEPLPVAADASVDGIESFTWDFGDPAAGAGNAASGQFTSHVYAQPGTYTITVTARSRQGATATARRTVTVLPAEPAPPAGR